MHNKNAWIIPSVFLYLVKSYDKDCIENVRVYLTNCGQDIVDRAINVKVTKAEVIWVFTDVERFIHKIQDNIIYCLEKRLEIWDNIVN